MNNIDFFHQILDLIEQHGLSVVLLVGLIIGYVLTIKWAGRKFDQIWKVFLKMKAALPDEKKENVEEMVKLNVQIRSLLKEALHDTHAGWVQLWQFHNGTRGVGKNKLPFMFLSLTNEAVAVDQAEMRHQFKELPLSMFDFFATQLITQDLVIHDGEMTNPDGSRSGMGKMMAEFGAKSSCMRAIRDVEGKVIGFMSFIYPERKEFSDTCRTKLRNYAQRMTALLASVDETEEENDKETK